MATDVLIKNLWMDDKLHFQCEPCTCIVCQIIIAASISLNYEFMIVM